MAKRKYKKRRGRRRRRVPRALRAIPPKMTVKMIYNQQTNLDPNIGTAGVHKFRANGLYDPDVTLAGHQPRTFDQFMALYDHFTVIGSRIKVQFVNTDTSYDHVVGVALLDTTTSKTNINDYLESDYEQHRVLSVSGGGSNHTTINMKCNPNKFLGRSHPLADSQLKGSASADPTEQAVWHLFDQTINDSVNGGKVYFVATVEYIVVLQEPKIPSQS